MGWDPFKTVKNLVTNPGKELSGTWERVKKNPLEAVAVASAPVLAGGLYLGDQLLKGLTPKKLSGPDGSAYQSQRNPAFDEYLLNRAMGRQADPASQLLLKQGIQKNVQAQASNAASARGTNAGLAQRLAAQNLATGNQQAYQTADINQTQNQNTIASQYLNTAEQDRQARMGFEGMKMGVNQANQASSNNMLGGLLSTAGTIGAAALMSDKNKKENIKDGSKDVSSFLDKISAYSYNYKNPEEDGQGPQVSVMAQDLEKSKIGKKAVLDTPKGKMVDYNKLAPAFIASLAEINERLKKIEG